MNTNLSTLQILSQYRLLFLVSFYFILLLLFAIIVIQMVHRIKEYMEEKRNELTKEEAMSLDYSQLVEEEKGAVIRKVISPDAINPGPDDHLIIYDAVNKVYCRSLTISKMARRVNFANTFAGLLDFPSCTSSIFIEPIDEQAMGKKLDRHLVVLEAEYISSSGDSNRQRKLQQMYSETNSWAGEIETGKNKFFRVGFVFSIYAKTLEQLTKATDSFRNLARDKGLDVTTCVCVQSEAYVANAPFNRYCVNNAPVNSTDGIFYHYMDKFSVATVFNYTSVTFSHRDGVPIGRDRVTKMPVIYNPYSPSFYGYTSCVAGKTGSGKSAFLKMLSYRCSIFGYRFASLDVQPRQGTGDGEYSGICELLGGINFQLKSDSNNVLNIFEVMESPKFVNTGLGKGFEQRDLDLRSAIAQAVNLIMIILSENGESTSMRESVLIDAVIREAVERIFLDKGIIDGDPDSLYIISKDGNFKRAKDLPTITDFYMALCNMQKLDTDEEKISARKIVILAMGKYVKDLYYSESTYHFFSKEEYDQLPLDDMGRKYYTSATGNTEVVTHIHGTRPYFDGQSTVRYSTDVPWINIDCSQLDEASKKIAMAIGMNYINERIIKGNSDNRDGSISKILCIFDEAHMLFKILAARALLSEIVATARKRSVGQLICTQTIREFEQYEETRKIRTQAASLFVFKQDYSDKKLLLDTLGLTEAQIDSIIQQGGDIDRESSAEDDEEAIKKEAAKHRGEMTLIINRMAIPIKVDYRKETERYAVETAADEIIQEIQKVAV